MTRERTGSTDHRDQRAGGYDGVNKAGTPQADQVGELLTPHQAMQPGADVRPEQAVEPAEVLPEGLRRPPQGPINRRRGRGN